MSSSKSGSLVGPSKCRKTVPNEALQKLSSALTDRSTQESISGGMLQSLETAGIRHVVRTEVVHDALIKTSGGGGYAGYNWGGKISVRMELYELGSLRRVARADVPREYEKTAGMALFFPVYVGSTAGRAMDQACRQALQIVLEKLESK